MLKNKKYLTKIILIFVIFASILSFTGCMTPEDRQLKKEYLKTATKVMEEYLDENYTNAKILYSKQLIGGYSVEIYPIKYTKFIVCTNGKKYNFLYE